MSVERIVVVGAGAAGGSAVMRLLKEGFDGEIHLVSREPESPYYRPALSKQLLQGVWGLDHAQRSFSVGDPVIRHDSSASGLDIARSIVSLGDGTEIEFDRLILAPGCVPRSLPHLSTGGRVGALNSYADMVATKKWYADAESLIIVGGGLIGSEAASVAASYGLSVTVIDPSPAPLERALGSAGNALCMQWHADAGIDVRLGTMVVGLEQHADRVEAVLDGGQRVSAAHALVSVGVVPDTAWLRDSGIPLAADGGILCGEDLLVEGTAGRVAAAGDAASWPSAILGARVRIEHWSNAVEQGAHAAVSVLAASAEPFDGVPTFWTEQHGHLVHGVGRPGPDCTWRMAEVDLPRGGRVWEAVSDGRTHAFILVDAPQLLGSSRRQIAEHYAARSTEESSTDARPLK